MLSGSIKKADEKVPIDDSTDGKNYNLTEYDTISTEIKMCAHTESLKNLFAMFVYSIAYRSMQQSGMKMSVFIFDG